MVLEYSWIMYHSYHSVMSCQTTTTTTTAMKHLIQPGIPATSLSIACIRRWILQRRIDVYHGCGLPRSFGEKEGWQATQIIFWLIFHCQWRVFHYNHDIMGIEAQCHKKHVEGMIYHHCLKALVWRAIPWGVALGCYSFDLHSWYIYIYNIFVESRIVYQKMYWKFCIRNSNRKDLSDSLCLKKTPVLLEILRWLEILKIHKPELFQPFQGAIARFCHKTLWFCNLFAMMGIQLPYSQSRKGPMNPHVFLSL